MVDWDGLENRCAGNGTVGSNPTLSATERAPVDGGSFLGGKGWREEAAGFEPKPAKTMCAAHNPTLSAS